MALPLSTSIKALIMCMLLNVCCNNIGVHAELNLENLDLNRQLPEELMNSNFSLNEAKDLFRNKCIDVAGEELGGQAYTDIESGVVVAYECINNLINFTTIQTEIDEASPRGELDVVFNKYCNKRTNALNCFDTFNSKLLPCLDKEEQESLDVLKRIIRSLLNFVCHKDGDQIALFIAEKGPECLESQKDNIQQCMNDTFSSYFNTADISDNKVKSLPKLVVGEKHCDDLKSLETCIVHHLEQCSEITPANLVESMFNFIKNETICRNFQGSSAFKQSVSSGNSIIFTMYNLISFLMVFCFLKSALPLP